MFIVKLANEVYELQGWEPPAKKADNPSAKPERYDVGAKKEATSSGNAQIDASKRIGSRKF